MKTVTADQMRELDRTTIERYGVPAVVLMENAGRAAAEVILKRKRASIAVICGRGNNGGDGFVAARYLKRARCKVDVFIIGDVKKIKGEALINFNIIKKMKISIKNNLGDLARYSLIVDAIFGTGFKGRPDVKTSQIIKKINSTKIPVISLDVPSGLDATTGKAEGAAICAGKTITFGRPKTGFYKSAGPRYTGKVYIADIGLLV